MSDIVMEAIKATGKTSSELFEEGYKAQAKLDKTIDVHNWRWAHSIWHRSGIVTKTIELYCTELLDGKQLSLDFAGDYDHLAEAFK